MKTALEDLEEAKIVLNDIEALVAIAYGDLEQAISEYLIKAPWLALKRLDDKYSIDGDPLIHQYLVARLRYYDNPLLGIVDQISNSVFEKVDILL